MTAMNELLRLADFANVAHSIKTETTPEEIATWIKQAFESTVSVLRNQVHALQADNTRLVEERRAVDERYMVEHFHRIMSQPVLHEPQVPSDDRIDLRVKLIAEEFVELLRAVYGKDTHGQIHAIECELDRLPAFSGEPDHAVDLVEFADACADLKYVIVGSELEFGIDGRPIFRGVHEANLKKLGGGKRADGKFLKPEGWVAFDVAAELRRQGWRA